MAAAIAAACGCNPGPPPPVVLITVDTLRADRLGCYHRSANRTPSIDRLAREGMLFEHAYCDVPWTTASMSSVMTGQYSSSHGVESPTQRLRPEAVTMAEVLHDHGYQTGAVIASFPLASVYGLNQGFDTYDETFSLPMLAVPGAEIRHIENQMPDTPEGQGKFIEDKWKNDAYRPDEDVTDAAIRWLDTARDPKRPFFLWVHYFGPHEKLRGDVGFVAQEPEVIEVYDADVEKNDLAVGRFLERLRSLELLDKSIVILHADHGQNLGENGVVGHGHRLDEASIRIPMLVRYPAMIPAGLRRVDVARNIDILPTVLGAARLDAPGLAGRTLLPSGNDALGERVPDNVQTAHFRTMLPTLFHTPLLAPPHAAVLGPVVKAGIRTPQWKLTSDQVVGDCLHCVAPSRDGFGSWSIAGATPLDHDICVGIRQTRLFAAADLDRGERDISKLHPDVTEALDGLVRRGTGDQQGLASDFALSPEAEEKLKSLGYLR